MPHNYSIIVMGGGKVKAFYTVLVTEPKDKRGVRILSGMGFHPVTIRRETITAKGGSSLIYNVDSRVYIKEIAIVTNDDEWL